MLDATSVKKVVVKEMEKKCFIKNNKFNNKDSDSSGDDDGKIIIG